jgi:hypothetical protein
MLMILPWCLECVSPFQVFNQVTDINKSWYELCAIVVYPSLVLS